MRVIAALAVVLLLSGCVPTSPDASPAPSPAPTPVFASEEEALAAAEEAYAAYLAVSDAIAQDGGQDPERLSAVASDSLVEKESISWVEFAEDGLRSVGSTSFDDVALQSFDNPTGPAVDVIRVFLCSDVSGVDVVDSSGTSVVTAERRDHTPFEVGFDLDESGRLLVASRDVWTGGGVCG